MFFGLRDCNNAAIYIEKVYILNYFLRFGFSYQTQINSDEALLRKYAAKYCKMSEERQHWTVLSMFKIFVKF